MKHLSTIYDQLPLRSVVIKSMLIGIALLLIFPITAQVTTGSTITFEAGAARSLLGAVTDPSVTDIDGHGLGVSADTDGNITNITINNTFAGISGGADLAVIMTATTTNTNSFSIKADNQSDNFGVTSFDFSIATGTTQDFSVEGYDDGV